MSLHTRRARAVRLERWAGAAMRGLLNGRDVADLSPAQRAIARAAWEMALAMEDERMRVIESLRGVDVEEP